MASHQQRREPLPADYQFPTHGVDCDCPPCRDKVNIGPQDRVVARRMANGLFYGIIVSDPALEPTADTPWAV